MEQAPIQRKKDNTGAIAAGLLGLVGGAALADYFEMDLFNKKTELTEEEKKEAAAKLATETTALETSTAVIYDATTGVDVDINKNVIVYNSQDNLTRDTNNDGIDDPTGKAIVLDENAGAWTQQNYDDHSLLQTDATTVMDLDSDAIEDFENVSISGDAVIFSEINTAAQGVEGYVEIPPVQ